MTPIRIEVGFSHDVTRSPAALPTSTRPDATPPIAAPRQNGISTDESANSAPSPRASLMVAAWPRIANAAPRKMIPSAARKSGIDSVEKTEPNATGKHVHRITSTKISHTWLASHTGLIERCTIPPSATRPAPPPPRPPAAPRPPGRQVPEARAEVGAAEHGVGDHAEDRERDAQPGDHQSATPPSPARRASRRSSQTTPAPRLT